MDSNKMEWEFDSGDEVVVMPTRETRGPWDEWAGEKIDGVVMRRWSSAHDGHQTEVPQYEIKDISGRGFDISQNILFVEAEYVYGRREIHDCGNKLLYNESEEKWFCPFCKNGSQ